MTTGIPVREADLAFARCPAVVILASEGQNMVSHWIDAIVVSRTKRGRYSVYCRKWGEVQVGNRIVQAWQTLNCDRNLASPAALLKALSDAEFFLQVDIDWVSAIGELARLDAAFAEQVRREREGEGDLQAARSLS